MRVKQFVVMGMLSSMAYLLMVLNFPVIGLPEFLKLDFSEVPVLIAAIIFGPMAGIIVEALKNVLHYLLHGAGTGVPIDQIANFTAGILFVLPTAFMFRKLRTMKGLAIGLVIGTISMTLIMSVLNYFVFLPAYYYFMNFPVMSGDATRTFIVAGILPFNFVKGVVLTIIFVLLFTRLKPWLQRQMV